MSDLKHYKEDSTMNLADNPFLQDLGYDLNFSNWPELFALGNKAKRDRAACKTLSDTLYARFQHLTAPHMSVEEPILFERICDVREKVNACMRALTQVILRVEYQIGGINTFASMRRNVFYEMDSMLVPGQRIRFKHNLSEMRSCYTAIPSPYRRA